MKKNIVLLVFTFISGILFFNACNSDNTEIISKGTLTKGFIVKASSGIASSRTYFDGFDTKWSKNDSIKIIIRGNEKVESCILKLYEGEGTTNGKFKNDNFSSTDINQLCAFYPATAENYANIDETAEYNFSKITENNAVMYAKDILYTEGETPQLSFKNAMAAIKMRFKLPIATTITSITLSGENLLNAGALSSRGIWIPCDDGDITISGQWKTQNDNNEFVAYAYVIPDTLKHNLIITATNQKDTFYYATSYKPKLEANKIYYIGKDTAITMKSNAFLEPSLADVGYILYANGKVSDLKYCKILKNISAPIGIVFATKRQGGMSNNDKDEKGNKWVNGYAMALNDANTGWRSGDSWGDETQQFLKDIGDTPSDIKNDLDGYSHSHYNSDIESLDAFKTAANYKNKVPAPEGTSGWYLPSIGQWYEIMKQLVGIPHYYKEGENFIQWINNDSSNTIFNYFNERWTPLGNLDGSYWSSSETNGNSAYGLYCSIYSNNSITLQSLSKFSLINIRSVLSF